VAASEPKDMELWQLVWPVICEARDHVQSLQKRREYIGHHYKFPTLSRFDSGFPNVSPSAAGDEPIDYGSPFGPTKGRLVTVAYEEMPFLNKLFGYVQERENLRTRFGGLEVPEDREMTERFTQVLIAARVLDVFDHVMHTIGPRFDEDDAKAAWVPFETGLVADQLPVEIHVPVVLTHFEADAPVEIQPDVRLEPIRDALQLARVPDVSWGSAVHSTVLAAATHSFVFLGNRLPNTDPRGYAASHPSFYPFDEIDRALAALRLVTGVESGYAHIFLKPVGWVSRYTGPLVDVIQGATVRRYPGQFDNWGWLVQGRPTTTNQQISEIGEVLGQLRSAPTHLRLAARRLSAAMLRDEEDDAVVDICIGLEAALGDATPAETTHKLALRTAAAIVASGKSSTAPLVAFRRTKRLYEWRSKLVHGSSRSDRARDRLEQLGSGEPALGIALQLLRDGLRAVLARPELQSAQAIDENVILGSLAPATQSDEAGRRDE
jgi:hypothetical protein